jgi:flagellin-specific chaperone FliS
MISRYVIFEELYLSSTLDLTMDKLRDELVELYARVLKYLAKANHHFGKSTLCRPKGVFPAL